MAKPRKNPLPAAVALGTSLDAVRRYRGVQVADAAQALGVSPRTLLNWHTGTSIPSARRLLALAACYGVTLDVLAGRADPPRARIGPLPQPSLVQLGGALAGARLRANLSQEQAAAAAQVDPKTVQAWERARGSSGPDALALLALADLYSCTLEALVGRADLPARQPWWDVREALLGLHPSIRLTIIGTDDRLNLVAQHLYREGLRGDLTAAEAIRVLEDTRS